MDLGPVLLLGTVIALAFLGMIYSVREAMLVSHKSIDEAQTFYLDCLSRVRDALEDAVARQQEAHDKASDRIEKITTDVMDRLQTKNAVEAAEISSMRERNTATVQALKDELIAGKINGRKLDDGEIPDGIRVFTTVDGKQVREDDLETF